jgi:hypothetical protein
MMSDADLEKSTTRQILIYEPDEDQLKKHLVGRNVSPGLRQFLRRLMKGKKWARKINIPSTHDNLAAALVFTSELKEGGLEIFSELHVFYAGKIMIEKWPVVGENEKISSLPKEAFMSIEIDKVRIKPGDVIQVTIQVPISGQKSKTAVRTFDFGAANEPDTRVVPHPLLE